MTTLWHYTCDHTYAAVGPSGTLLPAAMLADPERRPWMPWWARLVWLTDLDVCHRDALGLSSELLSCDRTQHRYRITDSTTCYPWTDVRRRFPEHAREPLEMAPGVLVRHWWVSPLPVPVEYAPLGVAK